MPIVFSNGHLDDSNKSKLDAMRHQKGATMNFRNQQLVGMDPIKGRFPQAALTTPLVTLAALVEHEDTVIPYSIYMAETPQKDIHPLMDVEDEAEDIKK